MAHGGRTARFAGLALISMLGVACGSATAEFAPATTMTTATSPQTTIVAPSARALLDESSSADVFTCTLGSTTIARSGTDSFYGSYLDDGTSGLEIVTLDFVSSARFVGPPPADASPQRARVLRTLGARWGSWGQPDTITLEELPVTVLGCLEWLAVDWRQATTVGVDAAGTVELRAPTDTGSARLEFTGSDGTYTRLLVYSDGATSTIDFSGDDYLGRFGPPGQRTVAPIVELTMDEYFALVGG